MNFFDWPLVEIAIAAPLLGAVSIRFFRNIDTAWSVALTVTGLSFLASCLAWIALLTNSAQPHDVSRSLLGFSVFQVDQLNGPLLPMVALLHLLTILMTSRVKMNRVSFAEHLVAESLRIATFACTEPWPLIVLLALGTIPPYLELVARNRPTKIFILHMACFVALLALGWAGVSLGWRTASIFLMLSIVIRIGTVPAHLWIADLFGQATFGTAILFATPMAGVYATLRLVFPVAPDWVLQTIGIASLITAVYTAGLAIVQTEARRFFACLFLSQASLILVGLELHTVISLSGSLGLWISAAISLSGLGLTLRALEARHGSLTFQTYRGFFDQTPELAVCFLLMGLGCVGFPGTLGFIALEVLVDGAIEANITIGLAIIVSTTLNGIAIVRVYFLLFTGKQNRSGIPMPVTTRERVALIVLSSLILVGGLAPQLFLANRQTAAKQLLVLHRGTDPVRGLDCLG
jgi:NADH-quinone oxidoreductase subunit M